MNFYLKYRPQTIDELDLGGVRKVLADIVGANKTSHAYLLTGPRGSGKTSTARILARIVNCEKNGKQLGEPCNKCGACRSILEGSAIDVIEIDAASNRGIDDIRDLKEKIRLAPVSLTKKVYIIDEVHMLTTEAFNALLKTLEEPPKHSLFILCTTETHKVPETIVSRCTRIAFTKATPEEMVRSFTRVVRGEGVKVDEAMLTYLGEAVDGSFRDGVKVLDQIISSAMPMTVASVQEVLQGVAGYTAVPLASALVERDGAGALECFRKSVETGIDITYLLTATMRVLRDSLLSGYGVSVNPLAVSVPISVTELVFKIDEVARKIALSSVPTLLVEMMIVEWCGDAGGGEIRNKKSESQKQKSAESSHVDVLDGAVAWRKMLGNLGGNNYGLGTLLSKAWPGKIQGDELTVYVQYDFHAQQLMTEKIRAKFEELLTEAVGQPMRVVCEVSVMPLGTQAQADLAESDTMDDAIAIFNN